MVQKRDVCICLKFISISTMGDCLATESEIYLVPGVDPSFLKIVNLFWEF